MNLFRSLSAAGRQGHVVQLKATIKRVFVTLSSNSYAPNEGALASFKFSQLKVVPKGKAGAV